MTEGDLIEAVQKAVRDAGPYDDRVHLLEGEARAAIAAVLSAVMGEEVHG